jgi:glycosyltransferase involved in cell wall biosynthesis
MKYLFVYKFLMKHIAENATAIIFISDANYHQGIKNYSYLNNNKNKTRVIYNGVDDFWLSNINVERFSLQRSNDLKLLYIGRLDENKNLPGTYAACKMLIDSGMGLNLTIVGGTEDELLNLLNLEALPQWVDYYEFTPNKVDIMNHYRRNDIFIMPSFRETFGLVYVEAISQGCHCICSRGQGIDGVFADFNVTSFCDPKSIDSIKNAIIDASEFDISLDVKKLTSYVNDNFSWSNIAGKYISILRDSV